MFTYHQKQNANIVLLRIIHEILVYDWYKQIVVFSYHLVNDCQWDMGVWLAYANPQVDCSYILD